MNLYLLPPVLLSGNIDWFVLICVGLAAWRVSHMLVYELGPWFTLKKIREYFGVTHDPNTDEPTSWPDGSMFKCVWCISVWVVLCLMVLPLFVSFVFATSAIACALQKVIDD